LKNNNFDLIVTGGLGFLGQEIKTYFESKGKQVGLLDLKLGHNLSDENFVKEWFSLNKSANLINCFAINDHIENINTSETFLDVELTSISAYLKTNVVDLFSVCREFIRNQNTGRIVNISSIYSVVSPRNDIYGAKEKNIGYGVSKAAVNQLTRHLAVHAAPNFLVNSLILGGIKNSQSQEFISNYVRNVPLLRMGSPTDIFGLLEYLCSESASYSTGSEFFIDGGWTAW
jgi:NAD(P)-dependent dehydrogenase (short-subunit alcohol dehydrogenase family)